MKKFFEKNNGFGKLTTRAVLAIVVGVLIIGGAVYVSERSGEHISNKKEISPKPAGEGITSDVSQNCGNIPDLPDSSLKLATKVIDGDTFLIEGGYSVRILGIDADEKGYPCYDAAKNSLEEVILNKEVNLERGKEDLDQYCRYLRYVFLGDENISLTLVKEGLAIARFSPEDVKYREEITQAEKEAKENKIGCKWSSSAKASEEKIQKTEFSWEKLTPELTSLKVIGACQAGNYYGSEMIIEGKVADAYRSKTNTIFFNFEKPYPNQCFTAVIFSSNEYKFVNEPENYYKNKMVRVKGEVKKYQGKPEIILETPTQIEVGK